MQKINSKYMQLHKSRKNLIKMRDIRNKRFLDLITIYFKKNPGRRTGTLARHR